MLLIVNTLDARPQHIIKTLGNGQRNLVLMLVDQVSTEKPELDGIWLLITHPQTTNITLVPVFWGDNEKTRNFYDSFTVTEDNLPSPIFLDAMSEHVLWDDYLLIDQQGLASIFNNFDSAVDDTQHLAAGPAFTTSTIQSLEKQAELWKSMCSYLSQVEGQVQMAELVQEVLPHFSSSLSWDDLPLYPWGSDNFAGNLSCEFPTLNMISP